MEDLLQDSLAYSEVDYEMWVLEEIWRQQTMSVGLLAVAGEEIFREPDKDYRPKPYRGTDYRMDKSVRVKDRISRVAKRLADKGLITQWPRSGRHGERALTLTNKGDEVLAEAGFENMNYGKRFRGKYVNQKHHFGMSRCSLSFRIACEIHERKGDVLPSVAIPIGEELVRSDSLWKLDALGMPVEYERSKKPNPALIRKMRAYNDAIVNGRLPRLGMSPMRVLWITDRPGQLPMLMEVAQEVGNKTLFLFTCEDWFLSDVQNLLVDPIWRFCDGEETYLEAGL